MNKIIIAVVVLLILGGSFMLLNSRSLAPSGTPPLQSSNPPFPTTSTNSQFSNPKKSAHYESNTPAHGATLAGVPINVVIDFNFDLAKPSDIKIQKDGTDYGVGETVIDENKLSMRRKMNPNSPDGKYQVVYNACWPDGSCHDGNFEYVIDPVQTQTYDNQTGKGEITINMSEISFKPINVKISKNTKVTWINDEDITHYVNTDSHPAHTYYLAQNSKALEKGDSYSVTFGTPGIYPYHCSAHAGQMTGSILVE